MDARTLGRIVAASRIGLGMGLVVAPGLAGRLWLGRSDTPTRVALTALGVRDVVIGVGSLVSVEGGGARPWLVAGATADATDGLVTFAARRDLRAPGSTLVAIVAAAGAGLGAWLQRELP